MRYWGYLAGKLVLVGVFILGLRLIVSYLPQPELFHGVQGPLGRNLGYTLLIMFLWMVATGMVWLAIWDQRYRCRTCARRLRMPIATGSWTNLLQLGRPRTEYICPFGHGTLKVEELQITGHSEPDWQPHEDIWKELLALDESKK